MCLSRVSLALGLLLPVSAIATEKVLVRFDPSASEYVVLDPATGWKFAGKAPGPISRHSKRTGSDAIGKYEDLILEWPGRRGTIRAYEGSSSLKFSLEYLTAADKPEAFPHFTTMPSRISVFSYREDAFAPYTFGLADNGTPALLFDRNNHAAVLSPASTFMVAKMVGDGKDSIGVSLNTRLESVPKGLRQDSLLVLEQGIGKAWKQWGSDLRKLYSKKPSGPDSDVLIEKFGYWTDNGADYYYNYDPAKGYAKTILDLLQSYKANGVPVGYLQLDSWWYRKLSDSISGERGPELKNSKFPALDWNRYGGILEYKASPDLFPNGLQAFSKSAGMPFAVHSRWIDTQSPLRSKYKVSGVAPVDPKYWSETAAYLRESGVTCFEQDWLDRIYNNSPEFFTKVGKAELFMDGMAHSMKKEGLTLQYCMALPRNMMQGVKYSNLTTIRTSQDRFEPRKWAAFLFTTPLAEGVGALPWADVFKSSEMGNMTLAALSAGPVGTGDAIGREDKANILKAARPDGVLVKPDEPIVPTDATYQNEAVKNGLPFVASTVTRHGALETRYLFAFRRSDSSLNFSAQGSAVRTALVNLVTGKFVSYVDSKAPVGLSLPQTGYGYFMLAPVTKTGVALFGDLGKIVTTGKQRIESMVDSGDGLRVRIRFAKGEGPVTLSGVSRDSVKVRSLRGSAKLTPGATFTVEVHGKDGLAELVLDGRR